ncbi:hypothetical protein IAE35_02175 [Pseudomonas sp. S75]|uniref:hypothetical protein n=1 Tax=unclassified Pseudomonas TaxID=196821 RepID=UPI0019082637|nr:MULTISPECIES: hypothetical protein [unclassified Pseudomonas]MBJ9973936.1 hypothetical protein [Pseudomonas sp. S30]MBK0152134.1 hypothetical protein [Pseudomonas sp. S75]
MTSINASPPLASPVTVAPASAVASNLTTPSPEVAETRSVVSLGQPRDSESPHTYTRQGLMAGQVRHLWESDSQDRLSSALLTAFQTSTTAGRFKGLGAALIDQLTRNGGQAISQSVFAVTDDSPINPAVLKLQQQRLRENPDSGVSLSLTTASGATIRLSLANGEKGLAVSAQVEGGTLTAEELNGLGKLGEAFEGAIDGLNAVPPQLRLGALSKLDPTLFTSLKMDAHLDTADGEQRFALTLDDSTRQLSLESASGVVRLNMNTQEGQLLGTADQRQSAIASYLAQFDAAQKRGHGDEAMTGLLKDAFTQLNSVDDGRKPAVAKPFSITDRDRVLLSGLADFTASISQTPQRGNPIRQDEIDGFSYQASQSTQIERTGLQDFSVEQRQQSRLNASFHQLANAHVPLSSDRQSQNYSYHVITDQASSITRLGFDKGKLIEASATQQASQKERVLTYADGVLTSDVTTPKAVVRSRELRTLLDEAFAQERVAQRDRRTSVLEGLLQAQRSRWWLQSDPAQIAE